MANDVGMALINLFDPEADTEGKTVSGVIVDFILKMLKLDRDVPDNFYGIAITVNTMGSGFFIKVPVLLGSSIEAPITDVGLLCSTDMEAAPSCKLDINNINPFIEAIVEEIYQTILCPSDGPILEDGERKSPACVDESLPLPLAALTRLLFQHVWEISWDW